MSSLLTLCLLIFHAIAPAPTVRVASEGLQARASGAASSTRVSAQRGSDVRGGESLSPHAAHHDSVAWVRDARPVAGVFTTRADAPVRTRMHSVWVGQLSMEAAFAASVRVRALDDSHAVSARGALLPYFATAPPLRG